jgi:BirA family transcriptional regulator, biotin operon repressor / biotin---[acetyl-CoA-carboxylase] ligase
VIGQHTIRLEQTNSTNFYLQELVVAQRPPEGTMVVAKEQTQGRGQRDNKWESTGGENLTFSFVVYPGYLKADMQFMLSKFVALALLDTLTQYTDNVKIKWPNDLLIGKKKIAGILIENKITGFSITTSVIGIGLNINQEAFPEHLPMASSLKNESGQLYNLETILQQLIENLNKRYQQLKQSRFDILDADYLKSLYQHNVFANYQDSSRIFSARIAAIDKDGRLCLVTENNEMLKFAFKEVHFL